jgi:glycosyltransferase involved in cell wall biosynthesis
MDDPNIPYPPTSDDRNLTARRESAMPSERARRRHCMVVYAYYPLAETRVQREAEALVDAGYAVDVICLRKPSESARERYRGVEIHRLPVRLNKAGLGRQFLSYLQFLALATVRLARLHTARRYDTVQVHNLPDFLVLCALVPKVQGVPVVLDLHDLMPEFFEGRFGRRHRWLGHAIRWQERLSCRFADHVVTVSEHWRDALIRRGVPGDKCSVVMNVADERIFGGATRPERHDGSHFELIYHGTVTYRYGLDLAVRAVGLVREDIPGVHLTILGRGDHMPALRALRSELALEDEVDLREEIFLAEDLPKIIRTADVGVVPYRNDPFTDGLLPTKLMEYAVMGLPCIASRTTAIEAYFSAAMVEFFTPGDVDDLARCMRELRASPERRTQLERGCVNFTRRYNWAKVGADYVGLIERLGDRG